MRKLLPLLMIACLILNASCKKVKEEQRLCGCVAPPPHAFISAQKNGTWWPVAYFSAIVQDSLKITANTNNNEVLGITIKYNGIGQYTLTGSQVYYHNTTSSLGTFSNLSNYMLDNTAVNTLVISKYDPSRNAIGGTFSLNLIKTYDATNTGFPQNVNFLNGTFNLPLAK
ncbi:DUF6252 family protein [Mucilaginibacter sp. AW1-3]